MENEQWKSDHIPGSRSMPPLGSGCYRAAGRTGADGDETHGPIIDDDGDDRTIPLDELFRR